MPLPSPRASVVTSTSPGPAPSMPLMSVCGMRVTRSSGGQRLRRKHDRAGPAPCGPQARRHARTRPARSRCSRRPRCRATARAPRRTRRRDRDRCRLARRAAAPCAAPTRLSGPAGALDRCRSTAPASQPHTVPSCSSETGAGRGRGRRATASTPCGRPSTDQRRAQDVGALELDGLGRPGLQSFRERGQQRTARAGRQLAERQRAGRPPGFRAAATAGRNRRAAAPGRPAGDRVPAASPTTGHPRARRKRSTSVRRARWTHYGRN